MAEEMWNYRGELMEAPAVGRDWRDETVRTDAGVGFGLVGTGVSTRSTEESVRDWRAWEDLKSKSRYGGMRNSRMTEELGPG